MATGEGGRLSLSEEQGEMWGSRLSPETVKPVTAAGLPGAARPLSIPFQFLTT